MRNRAGPEGPSSRKVSISAGTKGNDDVLRCIGCVAAVSGDLHYRSGWQVAPWSAPSRKRSQTWSSAGVVLLALIALDRLKVLTLWSYLLLGVLLWFLVLKSGIHATLAGVALALTIPLREGDRSPLHRLEHALHKPVAFAVTPFFGFANAGLSFAGVGLTALLGPVSLGGGRWACSWASSWACSGSPTPWSLPTAPNTSFRSMARARCASGWTARRSSRICNLRPARATAST